MKNSNEDRLVDAAKLLELLFEPDSRPSLRWLRSQQKACAIPYIRIGHLVRFRPDQVRAAIEQNLTVTPRNDPTARVFSGARQS